MVLLEQWQQCDNVAALVVNAEYILRGTGESKVTVSVGCGRAAKGKVRQRAKMLVVVSAKDEATCGTADDG